MKNILLTTNQMAEFTAKGYLFLEGIIESEINNEFINNINKLNEDLSFNIEDHIKKIKTKNIIPFVKPQTPLFSAYPKNTPLSKIFNNKFVAGAITSLVGSNCIIDHHFLHMVLPYKNLKKKERFSQPYHQDSTIDPRMTFDIQVFYFPTEITREMGGTRYIPGSQYRVISEFAISRYQNILGQKRVVCPEGTIGIFHQNLWHGGGINYSNQIRNMFKVRISATEKQELLFCYDKINKPHNFRSIFWNNDEEKQSYLLEDILTQPEPWFETDTCRLEYINRIKMWRYLTGDKNFDADYWMTRIENELK